MPCQALVVITATFLCATAEAQTQQGINTIMRDQQSWKIKQLPANAVLQNFGSTAIYAAATMMEREKQHYKALPAIVMPQPAKSKSMLQMVQPPETKQWKYSHAGLQVQTSFMKWLTNYLPVNSIQ